MEMHKNEIRNTKKTKQKRHTLTVKTKQQNEISTVTKKKYPGNNDKLCKECHKLARNRFLRK